MSNLFRDDLSQFAVIQGRCITIDAYKFGGTPGGRVRHKVLQKAFLDADRQPAATTCFHAAYQAFIGLSMPAPK
ncbi:hypothetical protein Geu3261_0160_003 [Komagataeibacter europaeus NBRC 3261]|uniref:Uncharacterized protein n=1 Tax=Komagataeibacter europaeus NBRC 3261 TaxID=1234669 RepID=A0A0D6Q1W2_KOMEU|nr:hypothetical protein Geu3261_0160_003 [Komagataeibacter europaeus NBRC 3261]